MYSLMNSFSQFKLNYYENLLKQKNIDWNSRLELLNGGLINFVLIDFCSKLFALI